MAQMTQISISKIRGSSKLFWGRKYNPHAARSDGVLAVDSPLVVRMRSCSLDQLSPACPSRIILPLSVLDLTSAREAIAEHRSVLVNNLKWHVCFIFLCLQNNMGLSRLSALG